jgi:protein TilB
MRITDDLLRKKAEHNEGMLTSLEEIALHQLEIERIELFDKLCRHIQIILLQNNLIEKIENLSKLKELKYLNLALNNITRIENLDACESLAKLDFTCNFIDAANYLDSIWHLKKCQALREIYLTGNPCTDFPAYRELLVAVADNITHIDGKEVLPSDRIRAKQAYEANVAALEEFVAREAARVSAMAPADREKLYTKEYRKKMYLDQEKKKEEEKKPEDAPQKPKVSSQFLPNGEMRQCNEGKYEFRVEEYEDPVVTTFTLRVPKFMDTSLLNVEVHPFFVSVRVKDRLTQIKLWEEVRTTPLSVQRATTTGFLVIKLQKIKYDQILARQLEIQKKTAEALKKDAGPTNESRVKSEEVRGDEDDDIPDLE